MNLRELLDTYTSGDGCSWTEEFLDLWTREPHYMATLVEDIGVHGILKPIHLGDDGRVWDGHHRLAAACALNLTEVPTT